LIQITNVHGEARKPLRHLLQRAPSPGSNLIPTMRGVAIAPAPIQTAPLLRPLPLRQGRGQQLSLPPLSSHCAGIAGVGRGFPLCGSPDAVSTVAPLRATASSSSPAAGSYKDMTEMFALSVGQDDLLIVGAGVLGRIVAEKWTKEHPGCQTFGQTLTTDHHDELLKLGIKPLLSGFNNSRFPYVIFCAPPSRSVDYPADVRLAASNWSGEGAFLFTSSSAVYDCNDNGLCNEDSPVVPIGRSPRTDVLLKAENAVLDSGGCVLRLAGLYISYL
ncbi:hypothetical protein Taro_006494, partial [Colocasia esculenta]|nr:hypothetical protein [Colocasia esculenta]